jgi:hypothetical protein
MLPGLFMDNPNSEDDDLSWVDDIHDYVVDEDF